MRFTAILLALSTGALAATIPQAEANSKDVKPAEAGEAKAQGQYYEIHCDHGADAYCLYRPYNYHCPAWKNEVQYDQYMYQCSQYCHCVPAFVTCPHCI